MTRADLLTTSEQIIRNKLRGALPENAPVDFFVLHKSIKPERITR